MLSFFDSLPHKAKSMQTSDITSICSYLSKFSSLSTISPSFWPQIASELAKRAGEMELPDILSTISAFSQVNSSRSVLQPLFKSLGSEIENSEFIEIKGLPFHRLEQLLATYTLKNYGSGLFYEMMSEAILSHDAFPKLAYKHLARLAYYFSRALTAKIKGKKLINQVESILWDAIHQGKLCEMEEITGVVSYIVPSNIGSNDLRALLEFTLYRFLSNPQQQITVARLCEVTSSFTHYIIKYQPLDQLLKQLVKDCLPELSAKELVQVLWSYARHNKAEPDFIALLLARAKEIIPASKLRFRHFTFLLNAVTNTGISDPSTLSFIADYSLHCLRSQAIQDHHLVKAISLIQSGSFPSLALAELNSPYRLPSSHPADFTRALIAVHENPELWSPETFAFFTGKATEVLGSLRPAQAGQTAYCLARLNIAEPRLYDLLAGRLLASDLSRLAPVDLGVACLGFGLVGHKKFCEQALSAVNDCFHKYRNVQYDDAEDTDQDDLQQGRLIRLTESDLEFTSEITASATVQMAWLAASMGVDDPAFWTERLMDKLRSVQQSQNEYRLNPWVWTAKTLRDEEEFIVCVDRFHYALLMQVLAVVGGKTDGDLSFEFVKQPEDFVKDVVQHLKKLGEDAEVCKSWLWVRGKALFLYENQHFIWGSEGYRRQTSGKDLLFPLKMQQKALEKRGVQCHSLFKGHWIAKSVSELALFI
jgi:hypothetical protein